ncbi:uncharacterized protein LOC127721336 [Mytilus californianus]|uniref:uncharacterized protein LOC127721336 n=1 Tax=Mytilus californianus TaxID=6549 RepID=UPI0022457D97|nr:uncharacterized protein LOC127721336 [Mytilus californianus]
MYRLIISLVFLFAWTLCEIIVIKKQKDKIYTGHMLFELSMPMWSLCAQFCSRVQLCKSINFIISNKTCQINDAEPGESNGGELIESAGNSFVAASTFPEELAGPCKGHGCKSTEVCMPQSPTYSCIPLFVQFNENRQRKKTTTTKPGQTDIQTTTTKPGRTDMQTSITNPGQTDIQTTTTKPRQTDIQTTTTKPGHTDKQTTTTEPGQTDIQTTTTKPRQTDIQTTTTKPGHTDKQTTTTEPGQTYMQITTT